MNSYSIVESINSKVNASVSYMSDSEQFGVPEWWSEARNGFDDCEDYALLKRELLKKQGFDEDESCVKVRAVTGLTDWSFDQAGVHGAIVENINGETLATNLDLYNKIRDTL